jgi:hypothetical protein
VIDAPTELKGTEEVFGTGYLIIAIRIAENLLRPLAVW